MEKVILKAKDGDEESLKFLLEKYRPYILKLASRYTIPGYDFEDLVQFGYLSVIKAIKKYKIGSHSYNGYIIRAVRNNVFDLLSKTIKKNNEIHYIDNLNILVAKELTIEEHIVTEDEMKRLNIALHILSEEERKIIKEFYWDKKSYRAMARENNLDYRKLIGEKNKVIEKIRWILGD